MKSHASCRPGCVPTKHEPDCPVAHPGEEARLREALRKIAEMVCPVLDGGACLCPLKMRQIAEEALRCAS